MTLTSGGTTDGRRQDPDASRDKTSGPGTAFTTLHFIFNFRMNPIRQSAVLNWAEAVFLVMCNPSMNEL